MPVDRNARRRPPRIVRSRTCVSGAAAARAGTAATHDGRAASHRDRSHVRAAWTTHGWRHRRQCPRRGSSRRGRRARCCRARGSLGRGSAVPGRPRSERQSGNGSASAGVPFDLDDRRSGHARSVTGAAGVRLLLAIDDSSRRRGVTRVRRTAWRCAGPRRPAAGVGAAAPLRRSGRRRRTDAAVAGSHRQAAWRGWRLAAGSSARRPRCRTQIRCARANSSASCIASKTTGSAANACSSCVGVGRRAATAARRPASEHAVSRLEAGTARPRRP